MPRKNFRRKRNFKKKRNFKRKKIQHSMVIRGPPIIPDRTFVMLKYFVESKKLHVNSSTANVAFRGNGAYDPEVQLGGHSPMGYDQWAQLYQNYRVHKSAINVTVISTSVPMNVSITPTTTANIPPSTLMAREYPYNRYLTIAGTSQGCVHVKHSMMTKNVFGLKSIKFEDNLQSTVGAIPVDQWFWNVNTSTIGTLADIYANVQIVYWVEFFNRVELTQSGMINDGIMINNQDVPFGQTGPTGPGSEFGGATGAPNPNYGATGGHGDFP